MNRLANLFRDERCFYRLLAIVGGAIAILKGMHMPLRWAATQAQLDYRNGFLRRGLFGEICRQLHIPVWRYGVFSFVSFLLLGCVIALLLRSARRSGLDATGMGAFTALLAGSFSITLLADLVGYFDIVMLLMVLLVMQIVNPRVQLAAAALAGIVGVLVHELYAIAYLPISLVGAMSWATDEGVRIKRCAAVAAAAVIPWIVVFAIARTPRLTAQQTSALETEIQSRVDFVPNRIVFQAVSNSGTYNLHEMLGDMHTGQWWVAQGFGLLAFLPSTCFFLALAWRKTQQRLLRAYLAAAVFAPLLLNLLGYDIYRWLLMMSLNAAIAAIAVFWYERRRHTATEGPELRIAWRRAAVFLLMISMATDIGLLWVRARNYPFFDYWQDFHNAKRLHAPVFSPPDSSIVE